MDALMSFKLPSSLKRAFIEACKKKGFDNASICLRTLVAKFVALVEHSPWPVYYLSDDLLKIYKNGDITLIDHAAIAAALVAAKEIAEEAKEYAKDLFDDYLWQEMMKSDDIPVAITPHDDDDGLATAAAT